MISTRHFLVTLALSGAAFVTATAQTPEDFVPYKHMEGILHVDGTSYRFMGEGQSHILKPLAGMTVDGENWSGRVSHTRQLLTSWTDLSYNDSS